MSDADTIAAARQALAPAAPEMSLLCPRAHQYVRVPADMRPVLLVVVDAEEEFDWRKPFSSANVAVTAMRHVDRAQAIFDRYGLRPTYAVDYPVATQPDGYGLLRDILADGRCEIGAQLHPWVTPPIEEEITARNSFPGNLPERLERGKIQALRAAIEGNFGITPVLYKAGRYGVGPNTPRILADLGFSIDASVVPTRDYRVLQGPSFQDSEPQPYWFGPDGRILEIPITCGFMGLLDRLDCRIGARLTAPAVEPIKLPAALARSGLLTRSQLTPEGVPLAEAVALTRALLHRGTRIFHLAFHSPSLVPGHTPYVQSDADLERFLGWLEGYFDFFFGEIGGQATTPGAVRKLVEGRYGC